MTVVVHPTLEISPADLSNRRSDLPIVTPAEPDDVPDAIRGVDGPASLLCANREWDEAYLEALDEGDWVATIGVGYDAYPTDRFADADIVFTNSPGVNATQVAEHAMALGLACTRRLGQYVTQQRRREWERHLHELTDLGGDRCCVIGLGDIGEEVARRASAFDMTVVGTKRTVDEYDGRATAVYSPADLELALHDARLVVAAVPLTDETRGLLDAAAFEACADDAIVVNVARGGVLDTDALLAALDDDHLGYAGLDVLPSEPLPADNPLWNHDRVLITPHVGGASDKYADRLLDSYLDEYARWQRGEPLKHRIV